jgi:hypothetical protein
MIAVSSSANQQHKSSPQRDRHIYGSSRLGMDTHSVELIASFFVSPSADGTIGKGLFFSDSFKVNTFYL